MKQPNYSFKKMPKGKHLTDKQVKFWLIVIDGFIISAVLFMYFFYHAL